MLGKGVSMEEDGGDDLEIAFDVIQDMVFVKDYRPRLHPPRHWQHFFNSALPNKYPLKTTTGTS